jgi:AraC-like DNA-binding protein
VKFLADLEKIVKGLRMAGNLAKVDMRSRRQTPRRHWAIVSRLSTTAGATVLPTMANVPKIHARSAGFIVDDLRRRRLAVDKLLQEVGLEKAGLSDPENRVPQTPVFHLMERAASLTGDASYGLRLGASVDPGNRGLLGFIALNSPTLIEAMANIQRFYKVGREGHDCEIERFGPQVAFRFRIADPALRGLRHTSEYLAATVVRGCRDLTCQSISPIRVEFIHDEPDERVEYFKFLGCPVKFGAEWDAVIYAEETTRLPVKGADTKLLEVLEATCQRLLGPTPKGRDLVREVRHLIIERLPTGSASLNPIARQLGVSSKTLERRLAQHGESFSTLLDRTRFNAVTHYLEDPDMSLTQVAYLAGYTEPATLVRAFKRWTGKTPAKFRERPRSTM